MTSEALRVVGWEYGPLVIGQRSGLLVSPGKSYTLLTDSSSSNSKEQAFNVILGLTDLIHSSLLTDHLITGYTPLKSEPAP